MVLARIVTAVGSASTAGQLLAQGRAASPRIGVLIFGAVPSAGGPDPFAIGLREAGLVEGSHVVLERRYAGGDPDRMAADAAELVHSGVDVIIAAGPLARQIAGRATTTIPIVAVGGSDPVREGWARSLARPGGNITGLTATFPELGSKRLQLLKEAIPRLERVALLLTASELSDLEEQLREMNAGASRLGLVLHVFDIRRATDIGPALDSAVQRRCQAVQAAATNTIVTHRVRVAELAAAHRLPSCSDFPLLARAGFVMTYGPDLEDLSRRSAGYVKRILDGVRPADLPIERPTKFSLVVNLKAARALGLSLPQALLLRADEVIE